jgi:thymidylate kinase
VVSAARRSGADLIIMDRYIYDELANLPLTRLLTRAFIRLVSAFVPQPDVAYLLDADPEVARNRKPEYPLEFLHTCRSAYFDLAELLRNMTIIPPLRLSEAKREVENALAVAMSQKLKRTEAHLDTAQVT